VTSIKTKTKKKKRNQAHNVIYCSPDGGETVYIQKKNGHKVLIHESPYSKYERQVQKESYLSDTQACFIRDRYPALKDAWEQYKALWALTVTDDDLNYPWY